jgi:hypothetical protein
MPKFLAIIRLIAKVPTLISLWSKRSSDEKAWTECLSGIVRDLISLGVLKPESPMAIKYERPVLGVPSAAYPARNVDDRWIDKKKIINPRMTGSKL